MNINEQIACFLSSPAFAVAGASKNRQKFGNKILRCYLQHQKTVFPLNRVEPEIEHLAAISRIADLPPEVQSISIVTPPDVTLGIVTEAIEHGIRNIWIQPGAQHPGTVAMCNTHGINLIADGSCLLVVLGYHDH